MKNEDNETEILLGNKQLLGIFFVVAVLLGVAFTGGYMVGHGSNKKTATAAATPSEAAAPEASKTSVGETHSVGAESGAEAPSSGAEAPSADNAGQDENAQAASAPEQGTAGTRGAQSTSSGRRAHRSEEQASASEDTPTPASTTNFAPRAGQTFLQVAAVGRTEAEAVADVLHKKGFHAHAVPKPGTKVYRVLIGPVRDTADLSATRDSLRRTGFRDVIVQRY